MHIRKACPMGERVTLVAVVAWKEMTKKVVVSRARVAHRCGP